jgi:hypothetical protein
MLRKRPHKHTRYNISLPLADLSYPVMGYEGDN